MFGNRRQVAARDAAAPVELFLDMRGCDREDVAMPLSGGETHECMRSVFRRMRTTVHPDRSPLLIRAEVLAISDDLLRRRLFLGPHPELQRPTINVRQVVGFALML